MQTWNDSMRTHVVRMRGLLTSALLVSTTLLSCESASTGLAPEVGSPRLSVSPSQLRLDDGGSGSLTASLTDDRGQRIADRSIQWSSTAPGIAAVTDDGRVEAKHPGEAFVRAYSPRFGVETTARVVVMPVAEEILFNVSGASFEGVVGAALAEAVGVRVVDVGGLPVPDLELSFEVEAGNGSVSSRVVTTDRNGNAEVSWTLGTRAGEHVLGVYLAGGAASATAASGDAVPGNGRSRRAVFEALATPGLPVRIDMTPAATTLQAGTTTLAQATAVDGYGNAVTDAVFSWTTTSSAVAGIDVTGSTSSRIVVARAPGTASIIAKTEGIEGVISVTVADGQIPSLVVVTPGTLDLAAGDKAWVTATAYDRVGDVIADAEFTWRATNSPVAGVNKGPTSDKAIVVARSAGAGSVIATLGGLVGAVNVNVGAQGPFSVTITPGADTLNALGAELTLAAAVSDVNGDSVPGAGVTWTSLDPDVATVDASGKVTSVTVGSARMEAVYEDGADTATVHSRQVVLSVEITPNAVALAAGDTVWVTAAAYDAFRTAIPDAVFKWTASNPPVAGVDATQDNEKAIVVARTSGVGSVTATAGEIEGVVDVRVGAQGPFTVRVAPKTDTLRALGARLALAADVRDVNGADVPGAEVVWTSLDPAVATVDGNGEVTSVTIGSARIEAVYEDGADTATVHSRQVVASVTVTPGALAMSPGDTAWVAAFAFDALDNPIVGTAFEWAATNPTVAGIDKGPTTDLAIVVARADGMGSITAIATGVVGAVNVTVGFQGPFSVIVTPGADTLNALGAELGLAARVSDVQGNEVATAQVAWSSLDPTVATVDENGTVTSLAVGEARIEAAYEDGADTATVHSRQVVASVDVSPATLLLAPGDTAWATASAFDALGSAIPGTTFGWTTTSSAVAGIDVTGQTNSRIVVARTPGTAAIIATAAGVGGQVEVTVAAGGGGGGGGGNPSGPYTVTVTAPTDTLDAIGASMALSATVTDGGGNDMNGAPVAWTSLDPSRATVDSTGTVTALAVGSARVTAAYEEGADTATVEVRQVVASIEFSPADVALSTGEKLDVAATALDAQGVAVSGVTWDWGATNPTVAGVDPTSVDNVVRAVGREPGSAFLWADADGWTDSLRVTVSSVGVAAVTVTPTAVILSRGETATATAVVTDANGNPLDGRVVTWTSSNAGVAVVTDGLITGVQSGSALVVAESEGRSATVNVTVSAPAPPPPGVLAAFPGAQGFGAGTAGGRGGAVYVVTSLADNASNPQPGTLRHALLQNHPRTIVFAVAGEIRFDQMRIKEANSDVTIAGQTAPGGGITLNGSLVVMGANDVVVRYVRFRRFGNNGFSMTKGSNVILDHVSVQFHTDDAFKIWVDSDYSGAGLVSNVTMSRSIVGPTTKKAVGGGWRGNDKKSDNLMVTDVDYHHNLFANNSHRTPRTSAQRARVVNNVVYNSRYKMMESVHQVDIDYINNYMRRGPMTRGGARWIYHEIHPNGKPDQLYPMAKIYVSGNLADPDFTAANTDNWHLVVNGFTKAPLPTTYRRLSPLAPGAYPIAIQSAQAAYGSVLGDVGANGRVTCEGDWAWNQDVLDASVIDHVNNRTGPSSPYQTANEAGGFPAINPGLPCTDSDRDGMPDAFETRYGLDVNGNDAAQDADGDGYTNIEEYTNATPAR